MKNSFSRFAFAALLSTVAGMVFAGENWKAPIPGGANQVSVNTGSGRVVDAKENAKNAVGNLIGRNTGGETVLSGNQGKVAFTQDANGIVRLLDGTVRPENDKKTTQTGSGLKTDKAQQQISCAPNNGPKKDQYPFVCHDVTVSHPFNTLAEAEEFVVNRWKGKYAECGLATESHALLVEKDGKYFMAGESWYQKKEDPFMSSRWGVNSAPGNNPDYIEKLKREGHSLIETMHNHHKGDVIFSGLYEWPTLSDVVSAIDQGAPSVVFNCLDNLYRIDNKTGMVYRRSLQSSKWNEITFEEWGRNDLEWQQTTEAGKQDEKLFNQYGGFDENEGYETMRDKLGVLYDGKNPTFEQLMNWWENVNASVNSAGAPVSIDGIRGWCKCGERAHLIVPGCGLDKGLAYRLCCNCGYVMPSSREVEFPDGSKCREVVVWDCANARALCGKYGVDPESCDFMLTFHRKVNGPLNSKGEIDFYHVISRAQEKFLNVPDGEVVIPGHCTCVTPDISYVGEKSSSPFIVCVHCGLVCGSDNRNVETLKGGR